jgi:hypothetical protein
LHDHPENPLCVRAQGHPDPEFLGALIHRKAHHPVEPDGGQDEGDSAENGEQRRGQAIDAEDFIVQTRGRAGEVSRQVRIQFGDRLAQDRAHVRGVLSGTRAHHDGAELGGGRGSQQRNVEADAIPLRIEWSLHQHIGRDPDDRAPRLWLDRIETPDLVAERALGAKVFSRETRIHDRDRLFRVGLFDREIAAFEDLQTEGGEIAVRD